MIEVSRATIVENEKNMGGSFPFATFDRDHSFEKEHENGLQILEKMKTS